MNFVAKKCNICFLYIDRSSGVTRVPCALGQEISLRPPSTKTTVFEVKNRCKSVEEAGHYWSYFVFCRG